MDGRSNTSGATGGVPRSLTRVHPRFESSQPADLRIGQDRASRQLPDQGIPSAWARLEPHFITYQTGERQPSEPLSDYESLSDGEIPDDAEPLKEPSPLIASFLTRQEHADSKYIGQHSPDKQPPEPLSPSEILNDEELCSDSELLNRWKPQSALPRARVETHSDDSEAALPIARKEPAEPESDLVGRQAGKITLWRDIRWSSTEKIAHHVRALELSGTRTDIIYTRAEVKWRQQKLDRRLKKMRNRLASAEAEAKKKAKRNDIDTTGKMQIDDL